MEGKDWRAEGKVAEIYIKFSKLYGHLSFSSHILSPVIQTWESSKVVKIGILRRIVEGRWDRWS